MLALTDIFCAYIPEFGCCFLEGTIPSVNLLHAIAHFAVYSFTAVW